MVATVNKVQWRISYSELLDTLTQVVDAEVSAQHSAHVELHQQLTRIRARLIDPQLHLAIIGDFSSGKSTLINAFLGTELLKSSEQKTTSIALQLHYGPKPDVAVTFLDGITLKYPQQARLLWRRLKQIDPNISVPNLWRRRFSSKEVFYEFIHLIGSNDILRPQIRNVLLSWPSPFLQQGISIIDTPGLNARDEHESITENVVKELADLALITIRSEYQLSLSTQAFITNHLGPFVPRCVFMITQADRIDEKDEFYRVEKYIRNQLLQWHVDESQILVTSALSALRQRQQQIISEEDMQWAKSFDESQYLIITYLQAHAEQIIRDRISIVFRAIEQLLLDQLHGKERALRQHSEELRRAMLPDLEAYLADQRHFFGRAIGESSLLLRNTLASLTNQYQQQSKAQMHITVQHASNKQELDQVVNNEILPILSAQMLSLEGAMRNYTGFSAPLESAHQQFRTQFGQIYQRLQSIAGSFRITLDTLPSINFTQIVAATNFHQSLNAIITTYNGSKDGFWKNLGRSLAQRQQQLAEYRRNLIEIGDPQIDVLFYQALHIGYQAQERWENHAKQETDSLIRRYMNAYEKAFEQLQAQQRHEQEVVENERNRITNLMSHVHTNIDRIFANTRQEGDF